MINKLDENSINKMCANNTIPDIPDILRELIDNSIDSNCSDIQIEIVDSGLSQIKITDNGTGINEENFDLLCKRGATTKIKEFEDVFSASTLGFRGQALSAIACLCDVTVITKAKGMNNLY